ncbi:UVT-5 protein [Aphelenchoides avenae]|nr:UVT-5 protein [Aphelenchus avenae]
MPNAWVTLATNDGYAVGALVLAHSLRKVGTVHKIHVLITDGVSSRVRDQLSAVFDEVSVVNVLDSNDPENLSLTGRPDLGVTFTKLHCWRLTQYEKAVFLDADTLVVRNSDELFERPQIAAAPDIGWPDCFNTGVFVFVPSIETYRELLNFALTHGSFDGGDQGLLNEFFGDWWSLPPAHRLPFIYNVSRAITYTYAPALKRFADQIKIVHFLGREKPWHRDAPHSSIHFAQWTQIYNESVRQNLPSDVVFGPPSVSDDPHYQAWESGAPDYGGRDAFENIQKQLERSLQQP